MGGERELAQLYYERTREELAGLEGCGLLLAGHAFAPVLLLKGRLNGPELAGGPLLAGDDGAALAAALDRLGYPADGWAGCSPCVRSADGSWRPAEATLLAEAVEVFDPELVIALDTEAADALQGAWGLDAPLVAGGVARVRGRRVLALGGFEAALSDPHAKQVMWARLKLVPPLGAPL